MSDTINVITVGHSSSGLNELEHALGEDTSLDLTRKLMLEGAVDPFDDLPVSGGVVILDLGLNWREVLTAVATRVRRNRTPMILIGPDGDTEMMRAAIKAGARDFYTRPLNAPELRQSIHRLANEPQGGEVSNSENSIAIFMSAKGGAGASAITTAIGHSIANRVESPRVLLTDLDLQYGNLPLYFDESSRSNLTQALIANDRIDQTVLDSCLITTDSGIDLLAGYSDQVFSAWETQHTSISNMMNLVSDNYDHVLVDIPRQIDPITFQAIERAASINIVMQQTLSDLRYTRQVLSLLRDQGLPNNRLRVIVNRYEKNSVLRAVDISDAFDSIEVTTLPNDFKRMSFATDNAVPLIRKFRKAPLTKALDNLAEKIFPQAVVEKRGLFGKRRVSSA